MTVVSLLSFSVHNFDFFLVSPFNISYNKGLVMMNSFSFTLSGKHFNTSLLIKHTGSLCSCADLWNCICFTFRRCLYLTLVLTSQSLPCVTLLQWSLAYLLSSQDWFFCLLPEVLTFSELLTTCEICWYA